MKQLCNILFLITMPLVHTSNASAGWLESVFQTPLKAANSTLIAISEAKETATTANEAINTVQTLLPQVNKIATTVDKITDKLQIIIEKAPTAAAKVGATILLTTTGYFVLKTRLKQDNRYFDKASSQKKLTIATNKNKRWIHWFKQKFLGKKLSTKTIEPLVVLAKQTQEKTQEFKDTLLYASSNDEPLPSLLLYGESGTGKSTLALKLGQTTGFDYILLSGSSLSQYTEEDAITKISEIFTEASKNKNNKTMIIIDEAEQLLFDRTQQTSHKAKLILTHFLTYTSSLHKNYTVVYTTQLPHTLDKALDHRITYRIKVGLPGLKQRALILVNNYKNLIANNPKIQKIDHANIIKTMEHIADITDGFSAAKLEKIIKITTLLALVKNKVVNQELLTEASYMVY